MDGGTSRSCNENRKETRVSKGAEMRLWLRFLLFIGQRKQVVTYLRYHGLLLRDVEARRRDLRGAFRQC